MTPPVVTETPRALEPVSRDPFIDDMAGSNTSPPPPPPDRRRRIVD